MGNDDLALAGFRVLIVEDEMLVAMEFEALLDDHGCRVLGPVPSIPEGLALLDAERPDAALLDVNLGGRRTTPLAAALRARGVPFVVVTGYDLRRLDEPALRGSPWVRKPAEHRELLRALARALAG